MQVMRINKIASAYLQQFKIDKIKVQAKTIYTSKKIGSQSGIYEGFRIYGSKTEFFKQ